MFVVVNKVREVKDVDAELREYLKAMEQRLTEHIVQVNTRLDQVDARTGLIQTDMQAMEQRLTARVDQVDARIDLIQSDTKAMEQRLAAHIVQVNTRLDQVDARTGLIQTDMQAMEQRLTEAIRERKKDEDVAFMELGKLEKRVTRLEKLDRGSIR